MWHKLNAEREIYSTSRVIYIFYFVFYHIIIMLIIKDLFFLHFITLCIYTLCILICILYALAILAMATTEITLLYTCIEVYMQQCERNVR